MSTGQSAPTTTFLDIAQQRLHNQHLLGGPFARPDEVVAWFGAVQAQEYPGATWGIAQRMHGLYQAFLGKPITQTETEET